MPVSTGQQIERNHWEKKYGNCRRFDPWSRQGSSSCRTTGVATTAWARLWRSPRECLN